VDEGHSLLPPSYFEASLQQRAVDLELPGELLEGARFFSNFLSAPPADLDIPIPQH